MTICVGFRDNYGRGFLMADTSITNLATRKTHSHIKIEKITSFGVIIEDDPSSDLIRSFKIGIAFAGDVEAIEFIKTKLNIPHLTKNVDLKIICEEVQIFIINQIRLWKAKYAKEVQILLIGYCQIQHEVRIFKYNPKRDFFTECTNNRSNGVIGEPLPDKFLAFSNLEELIKGIEVMQNEKKPVSLPIKYGVVLREEKSFNYIGLA